MPRTRGKTVKALIQTGFVLMAMGLPIGTLAAQTLSQPQTLALPTHMANPAQTEIAARTILPDSAPQMQSETVIQTQTVTPDKGRFDPDTAPFATTLEASSALDTEAQRIVSRIVFPSLSEVLAASEDPTPFSTTPEDPAPTDPALAERMALARRLMLIDGTDDRVRQSVSRVHIKRIVLEVNKYIKINQLSENERFHLSNIVTAQTTKLGDRILDLYARHFAALMSNEDLLQLIHDLDIAPQKKQTRALLTDTDSLDRQADLELEIAKLQIVKTFESAH